MIFLLFSLVVADPGTTLELEPTAPPEECRCLKWTQADGGYQCEIKMCPLRKP